MNATRATYHRLADGRLGVRSFRSAHELAVLAIPHAGGQSLSLRGLALTLPENWGVWGVDLPGHGWAAGDPVDNVEWLAELCLTATALFEASPVLLVGSSFGGYVCLALTSRLEAMGKSPVGTVLVGTPPPHRRGDYPLLSKLDETSLVELLVELGGMPAEWADMPDLLSMFLPALLADIRAFESFDGGIPPIESRVLAVCGEHDPLCRAEHLAEWAQYGRSVVCKTLSGGHLLAQSDPSALGIAIQQFVEQADPSHSD